MAQMEIIGSRRIDTTACEFDVALDSGEPVVAELFSIEERGTLWEWVIRSIKERNNIVTLTCANWISESGAFVGRKVNSRPMKAVERKRYAKLLCETR